MTFGDRVLHLVRADASVQPSAASSAPGSPGLRLLVALADPGEPIAALDGDDCVHIDDYQPWLADLEASVALVAEGLATRVIMTGVPRVPGLLWRVGEFADTCDVAVIPIVVRSGSHIDIEIARRGAANG